MQNRSLHAVKAFFFIGVVTFGLAHAQQRCDLVSKDTTINGAPAKQCLDIDSLAGKTVVIPSNVTRLDNQGFALCTKSVVTGGDADIVFILDQSGSMNLPDNTGQSHPPVAYVSGNDTLYYQSDAGCTNPAPLGVITIQPRVGAAIQLVRITSNAGCLSPAGDPFKVRALAVSRAIDYIASVSSKSTVGYLPFSTGIQPPFAPPGPGAGPQRPLALTAANITLLKSRAIIDPTGGNTNYDIPLDSSKAWLNNRAITPSLTNKHVIIFISDGAPNPAVNDGFAKNASGFIHIDKNIPIYSVFLGNANSDTSKLKRLSDTTGGLFYRIPPAQPDSIISQLTKILNKILKTYVPSTVTVTRTSPLPVQTSSATTAAQFIDQGSGGSFKILLDSTLALQNGTSNAIQLIANFRDVATNAITSDTTRFNLSTTGAASGTITGGFGFTSKCFTPTSLRWLNAAGVRPAIGYFTDVDNPVQLQLTTSPNGLSVTRPMLTAIGRPNPDSTRKNLPRSATDSTRYFSIFNIAYNQPAVTDTILQTKISDSLVASWINPRDPQDFARDTIPIHPTYINSFAYFSSNINGTDTVSLFDTNVTQAYIVVRDQRGDFGRYAYNITVTTTSLATDQVNLTLVERSPGLFSALINLSSAVKNPADAILEFSSLGDRMTATYTDPAFPSDQSTAQAGIGKNIPIRGIIQFTDAAGAALPSGTVIPGKTFWALSNTAVYFKYTDYNIATQASVPVQITARSVKLGQTTGTDIESRTLSPRVPINASLASWRGSIPLAEAIASIPGDNILQGAYRIEVTITAPIHDSDGNVLAGQLDSANLIIAWPDGPASLSFSDAIDATDSAGPSAVIDTLKDQDFVHNSNSESVTVKAACPSGSAPDTVSAWTFTQTSVGGPYVSERLVRNNAAVPDLADNILSCPADSGLVVLYTDPVYGTGLQQTIPQVQTPVANPKSIPFTTGLNITMQSGTSGALINYTIEGSLPRPGQPAVLPSQIYDGSQISIDQTTTLRAVGFKSGYLRSRVIFETYLKQPALRSSYIKDLNGDGKADAVTLVFERPVITFPAKIDSIFWNQKIPGSSYVRAATAPSHSADSLTLTALPDNPFLPFLTGIPAGLADSLLPVAKFPLGNYFNGLRAVLADSVGPVIHTATRLPSDLKTYNVGGQTLVDPDTLIVTTSEPLAPAVWKNLLRYKNGAKCPQDVSEVDLNAIQGSSPVFTLGNSEATPLNTADTSFKLIVDNTPGRAFPRPGDCIYLDTTANPDNNGKKFADASGNIAGVIGVPLFGGESKSAIYGSPVGYPPVSGLTPGSKAFNMANAVLVHDPSNPVKSPADLKWVPPVDFPATWNKGDIYSPVVDTSILKTKTTGGFKPLLPGGKDQGLSLLQVVASTKYTAHVHLSDHLGNFVKSWDQKFGYGDDLKNNPPTTGGVRSYLVWDERDSKKQLVGSGVYVWTVNFETKDSTGAVNKETHVTRTGLVR